MVWPYLILLPLKSFPNSKKHYGLVMGQAMIRCSCNWSVYTSKKCVTTTADSVWSFDLNFFKQADSFTVES